MANELVKKEATELAEFDAEIYGDVKPGSGFEGVKAEDIAIPYLRILQALSGEVKDKARRIEGAEIGDIYLSAVGRLYKGTEGVRVVPCAFKKVFTERLVGVTGPAGFVALHPSFDMTTTVRSQDGKYDLLENGHHIVQAAQHFVIINDNGDNLRAVISFASTQRKKSRAWLATMGAIKWERADGAKVTPPSFSHQYLLTTGEESAGANDWSGWVIGKPERITDRGLALEAKKLYQDVVGGTVTAGVETEEVVTPKSEDIPF